MGKFKCNRFRWLPVIGIIGVLGALLLQAGLLWANSADISATVTVVPRAEALTASAIPLGSSSILPGQREVTVMALSVRNTYAEEKHLTSLTVHDASRGLGTPVQLLSNLDSLFLFRDSDGDSLWSLSDSLITAAAWEASTTALTLGSLDIGSDSSITLLLTVNATLFPHDGDTVDVFVRPASDIETADATPIAGPDSLNSLGFRVIDGLVAAQLNTPSTGLSSIGTGDTVYNVFTVDIPRNGYATDMLRSFTIHNSGTADETDLEFVVLFSDNGNGVWGGFAEENLVAPLEYIGAHWAASDLSVPLTAPTTRFYVGTKTLPYPVNGATLIPSIPEYGLLMASRNDGPLDTETSPVDTIEIQSDEGLLLTSVSLSPGMLIPGETSSPVFAIEMRNSGLDDTNLDSLILQLELDDPRGGALQADLESQIDSILLYADGDGDLAAISPDDLLVATAAVTDGPCLFPTGGILIAAGGGEVGLSVVLATNLFFARDGNTAQISLESGTDVFVTPNTTIFGSFPVVDAPIFTVDAFPARKVTVYNLAGTNLYGGQTNMPVLDFVAPANGYASDTLRSLVVENIGGIDDEIAIEELLLWSDRLDDGFTADDIPLAGLTRGPVRWSASNISQSVPSDGKRMILTVNISDNQFDGGTLALSIPTGGMTYASGMVGPDDEEITDESTHLIIPPQRITVVSVPAVSSTVRPGQTGSTILTFALYNGYISETKTLKSVRFENLTRSASDDDYADHEIGRVRLYYDADANRVQDGDPSIGSGYFQNGILTITGLSLSLPSESLAYFFVQSDVALDAIDSDSLGLSINGIADLTFQEVVSINGDLPLTSGGWRIIDGSVKRQYQVLPLASRSATPGDDFIPVMAFQPASNGDRTDTLVSVSVVNLGTADTDDIANLRLWQDSNADDTWQLTDAIVGDFSYIGGSWSTGGFALPVEPSATTLFITGGVLPGATDGNTINLSIPVFGCMYSSANDGPLDSVIQSGTQITITGSSLRIAHSPISESYSVGETIEVEFSATNLSLSTMDSVVGICTPQGDLASLRLDSVHLGPEALASTDSAKFAAYYTAMEPGTVFWSLQAVELVTDDSSSVLNTEFVYIQTVPSHVDVDFVSSLPATVTLGQKNIIPFSLGFAHGDSDPTAAPAVLDSMRLRVYDGAGNALAANSVFARMRLITDEMYVSEPAEIPASSSVSFVFDNPIVVEPGHDRSLSAVVDIDSFATATDFVLAVSNASSVIFRDQNSAVPVTVVASGGFPLITTASRIDRPPDRLLIAARAEEDRSVNLDQTDFQLLRLALRHPGISGTAPIQCTGFSIEMEDDAHQPVVFSDIFDEVLVVKQGNVLAMLTPGNLDTGTVTVTLASPPILGPGETDSLDLLVDISSAANLKKVRLVIADSTCVQARNFSTGEDIPVSIDTDEMPPGSSFPLYSGWVDMKYPAQAPLVCLSSTPDAIVLAGSECVTLMSMVLSYPVTDEFSSVHLHDISLMVLDTTNLALDPRLLFDRLGYIADSSTAEYQVSVNPVNGQTVFEFGADGILLNPSDSITIRLVADLNATVPYDHFILRVGSLDAIRLTDNTDSLLHPVATLRVGCEGAIPFVAGPLSILWPAGRPTLTPQSPPLTLAAAGQKNVPIFEAILDYSSLVPRGDLIFESLTGDFFKRTKSGLDIKSGSAIFESLRLKVNEVTWANDSSLSTATLSLQATGEYHIEQGSSLRLQLEGDVRTNAPPGNYVYHFSDSTFVVFSDNNVDTLLYPILAAAGYPLASTELNISAADLKGSFTNYPNPFVPSREETTTFGYFLSEDADVDIILYTPTGDFVVKAVEDLRKAQGYHSEDSWNGRNGRGLNVSPGTYIGVITARYVSGREESARRKVTVVR